MRCARPRARCGPRARSVALLLTPPQPRFGQERAAAEYRSAANHMRNPRMSVIGVPDTAKFNFLFDNIPEEEEEGSFEADDDEGDEGEEDDDAGYQKRCVVVMLSKETHVIDPSPSRHTPPRSTPSHPIQQGRRRHRAGSPLQVPTSSPSLGTRSGGASRAQARRATKVGALRRSRPFRIRRGCSTPS